MPHTSNRQLRLMIRSFLLTATPEQIERELEISRQAHDTIRIKYIQEIIDDEAINGPRAQQPL